MFSKIILTTAILFFFFLALIPNQAKCQVEWVNFYSMKTIFDEMHIPIGTVINAYDPDSVHCGTFTVTAEGQYGFLQVYRDDAITPDIDEGASPGDTITFTINGYPATPFGPDPPIWSINGASLQVDLNALFNRPPGPFNLLYPGINAVLDTLDLTFDWEESSDIDTGDSLYYKVLIAFDSLFTNILIDRNVADSFYLIDGGLVADSQYYWKVYAIDRDSAVTSCNTPYSFKTSQTATKITNDRINFVPLDFTLYQNHPNPFNPKTTIRFDLHSPCQVSITVYNLRGQQVVTLVDEGFNSGKYSVSWDSMDAHGSYLPSGVYIYVMKAENFKYMKKMILIK